MASNRTKPVVRIEVSQRQIDAIAAEVGHVRNGLNRVIMGAVNKVASKGRTVIVDDLKNKITVKRSNIFRRTKVLKAHPANPVAIIRILARTIGLVNFKHKIVNRMRKRRPYGTSLPGEGVFVQQYQGGPTLRFPHSFKAKGKPADAEDPESGNVHIFERVKKGGKIGTKAGRFPLTSRKGLSLLRVYDQNPEMAAHAEDKIAADLDKELKSQVDRVLRRKRT